MHLFAVDGEGGAAVLDMASQAPPGFFAHAHILYIPLSPADDHYLAKLRRLEPDTLFEGPSLAAALPRFGQVLATARMGTRLYLAGTEGLIGQATRMAMEAGMDHASIEAEHRGSLARRVQCVHCKGITEDVTSQPCRCSHCGLTLLVRDHYSRRVAAFQGVCIDAEDPGVVPPLEELFK
nr:dimethylamine monooxygenase subunit DmmA family protein [Lichenifustis flavocetrariae]